MSAPIRRLAMALAFACICGAGGAFGQTTAPAPDPAAVPKLELSQEQRQVIFTSAKSKTHKSTAAPPNFLPAVGVHVPDTIEVAPLPDTVVQLVPRLRGYEYAMVANQVLIIDSKTKQVVELITQ